MHRPVPVLNWLAILAAVLGANTMNLAHAAHFCTGSPARLHDGGTTAKYLKIVVSSVPRTYIPYQGRNSPWCCSTRRSIGGHSSTKLLVAPKLGKVRLAGYRICYRSDKVGKDRFVLIRRWKNWINNRWNQGKLIYEIEVVPKPF